MAGTSRRACSAKIPTSTSDPSSKTLWHRELYAHGFAVEHSLFYFNSKKQGELDFVVEYDNQVLPIEVKSGKDYDRHNALANVMRNEDYAIPQAFVFCQENVFTKQNIIYYPIYLIAFFEQINVEDATFKFDLTGLT